MEFIEGPTLVKDERTPVVLFTSEWEKTALPSGGFERISLERLRSYRIRETAVGNFLSR